MFNLMALLPSTVANTQFRIVGPAEKDLESAKLVQILHRLLADERSAPEIKYNSMVLICALMGSGMYSFCHLISVCGFHQIVNDSHRKWLTLFKKQ